MTKTKGKLASSVCSTANHHPEHGSSRLLLRAGMADTRIGEQGAQDGAFDVSKIKGKLASSKQRLTAACCAQSPASASRACRIERLT